jgi:hypothetical protein
MNAQFESEFERPKRPGDVLVVWRNKRIDSGEKLDRKWHRYKFMSEADADIFIKECAPNSTFFEYRIYRELDKSAAS